MLKERYENTRLGRQELYAEILEDIEGSLFKRELIDGARVKEHPPLTKIVIAVDPAVTSNVNSDETGIVVVGRGEDNHYYILDDRSGIYTPDDWIKKAIGLYYEYEANYITAEVNNGGDLIERLLRVQDAQIPYRAIRSTKGKMLRAEPISSLYEQSKVHHVGFFKDLEEQMCQYTGNSVSSPDRLDALVFGVTSLQNSGKAVFRIS
jgi:predicted phage terminase large subunit-like protein